MIRQKLVVSSDVSVLLTNSAFAPKGFSLFVLESINYHEDFGVFFSILYTFNFVHLYSAKRQVFTGINM